MEVPNRPFLTTVVGSLPKPPWLQEKLPLNTSGKQVHGKGAAWLFEGELLKQAQDDAVRAVSYTHLRAHETREDLVCRLLLEKKH